MAEVKKIERARVIPESEADWLKLRTKDITSTESAALFGLSPYVTPFELWHRKREGNVVEMAPNERMKWGSRLQDSIARGIAEDENWTIERRVEYERLPEFRIGSSYDFTILGAKGEKGLLEIKNVDPMALKADWIVDGDEVEAPLHIEMQVQHQLLVSGLGYAYIGALVGGNRAVLIRREPVPSLIQQIIDKTEEFWASVRAGKAPAPDFSRDSKFISKLYQEVRPGKVVELPGDEELLGLAEEYKRQGEAEKAAAAAKEEAKAKILMRIGDAEKALGKGFSISAGSVAASRIEYDRAAYRNFRVNFSKSK